jgi:hypothetical protein
MGNDYVEVELVDWDQLLQVLAVRREFLYRRRENQSQELERLLDFIQDDIWEKLLASGALTPDTEVLH